MFKNEFPRKDDILFKIDNDCQNNACINTSHDNDYAYVQGYKDIADLACESLINGKGTLDTLVIPICYNYRHYIELTLKGVISMIYDIESNQANVPSHHRIDELWSICFAGALRLRDDVPKNEMKALGKLINEFSELDPKGEEFRYLITTDQNKNLKKSLNGINHINIRNLYEVMGRVDHLLSCTDLAIGEIHDSLEYCY